MNKKYAFTLIEIVIVMAIVGIITTIGVQTFTKHSTDCRYLYSNVYHTLDQAIYNAMNYTNLDSPFVDVDEHDKTKTVSSADQVSRLCTMLTNYIANTRSSCEPNEELIMPIPTDEGSQYFAEAIPSFVAVNGVRFYISEKMTGFDGEHSFFVVFADINGSKGPNSMHYERGVKDPDVFAFAVLDIGRVCPLGPPEIDDRYMLTRIRYVNNNAANVNDEFTDIRFSEPSKPYFVSKAEAWGMYLPRERLCDENDTNCYAVSEFFYIEDNPYTYNEYVRNAIGAASSYQNMIYDNVPNMNAALWNIPGNHSDDYYELMTGDTVFLRSGNNPDDRGYGCVRESDDECQVIIDKFVY